MTPHPAALLGLLIAAAGPTAPADSCPLLPALAPLICIADAAGFVYGRDAADAQRMTDDLRAARDIYRTHFDRVPPRGAVVITGTQRSIDADQRAALRAAGAQWVLPWIDAADRARALEPKIRAGIEKQMPDLSAEAVEAAVARALASVGGGEGNGSDTSMRSALRHELGHLWLVADRWPRLKDETADGQGERHYGGPAPDWLDETAAVLMEDSAMTAGRRALFGAIRRGEQSGERVVALADFVTMDHPLAHQALPKTDREEGTRIMIVSGEEAQRLAGGAKGFYAQARVFADYLIARSGQPEVFASIADAAAAGLDFAAWLDRDGPAFDLPRTLPALERDWQDWIAADYPAAP